METLMAISATVIAAVMVLALIFLIPVLLQVRRTAKEAETLIDTVRVQVAPISRDIGLISRDVQSIAQFIHRQADRVETGIETVHDMAVRVKAFQIEIQRRIMMPLVMLTSVLGGFKQGIETMARCQPPNSRQTIPIRRKAAGLPRDGRTADGIKLVNSGFKEVIICWAWVYLVRS